MISSFPVVAGRRAFKGLEWSSLFTFLTRYNRNKKERDGKDKVSQILV